jgi:hypothetical protein
MQQAMAIIPIDETSRSTSSQPPYQYSWNTRSVSNGDHEIEIRISNANGQTILSEKRMMDVENR